VFYVLTLPFRIFFGLLFAVLLLPLAVLFVPFLLLRAAIKLAALAFVAPLVLTALLVAGVVAAAAVFVAVLLPLLPFALVALVVWAIVRPSQPALVRS